MAPRDGPHAEVQAAGFPPHRGDGAGGVSFMVAARALAVNAGAAASQRPARPPQRPSMRVYRRAPPGYQLALPLYRPARRSMSWLGSAFFFALKLLASGWRAVGGRLGGNGAVARELEAGAIAASRWQRDRGPFQRRGNHRLSPPAGGRRRGSRVGSRLHGRLGPGAAVELSAAGEDDDVYAAGAGRDRDHSAPGARAAPQWILRSRVSLRNARSSRARSWNLPPGSGE